MERLVDEIYTFTGKVEDVENDYIINVQKKLKEYEDAEEQGLLLRLPVPIGSDVYFIPSETNRKLNILSHHEENNRVYHQKVARIVFTKYGWYLQCDMDYEHGTEHILADRSYKETWFLTSAEAEAALAEKGGAE